MRLHFEEAAAPRRPLSYVLHVPKDIGQQAKWPLVIYLHGLSARGDNLDLLETYGLPQVVANGFRPPAFIGAPQLPDGLFWPQRLEQLSAWLDHLLANYPIDPKRITLTGVSLGGYGVWYWGGWQPERFAGLLPLCGGGNFLSARAVQSAKVPVWAVSGAIDTVVPLSEMTRLMDIVTHSKAQKTIYADADHDDARVHTTPYTDSAIWDWLLSQHLDQRG
jgi:predicted peptidase